MKWIVILLTLLISACNSQQSKLSSIGGIGNSFSPTAPYITSVTVPANGLYTIGQTLNFSFKFSKVVEVQGSPRLAIQSENAVRHAIYVSGTGTDTLQFSYTIADGISDDNGITISLAIDLNGGSIFDPINNEDARLTYSAPATWGILINASTASLLSITPPANGLYGSGSTLRFIATFSERVCGVNTPRLALNINGVMRYATRVAEPCATKMKFDYVVQVGENDNNGVQLVNVSIDLTVGPAAIKDSFNEPAVVSYAPATYAAVLVGSVPPVEQPRTAPADDTYAIGENLDFTLNFNKNVVLVSGTPQIKLNVGGVIRDAFYLSGNGTPSLKFRYTVAEGESDSDGITSGAIQWNGSSIQDSDGNNAPISQSWPSFANIKVDGVRPTIASITRPIDGIYRPGGNLDFVVNWSESVTFSGPTPYINLTLDSHLANKEAHSHTNNGLVTTYRYSLQNGDADFNGIGAAATLTVPVGGTVTDAAGNTAYVTYLAQNTAGVYVAPVGVDHWYDARNPASTGASGATLTQFKDLIGTTDFYDITPPNLGGSPKKIDFTNGIQAMQVGTFNNFQKIYIVLETKGSNPGYATFESFGSAGSTIAVDMGSGIISTSNIAICGSCAKYFNGTNWVTTPANGNFGTYALNTKKIIMLDYQGTNGVELNFGAGYIGYIHEIYLLSGTDATTYSSEFLRALQAKHPGAPLAGAP